jgi:MFS family permease
MKANNRGKGLAIELAINIFGVMLSYWVDYGMSYVENESQFRFPLALQILFAIVTFFGIMVLPESPRWLIAHDRHDEARQILWAVQKDAKTLDIDDPSLSRNMAEIQNAIKEEREAAQTSSFKAMFKNGDQKFLYRTLLGIGGQFMQQLSGINLITYVSSINFTNFDLPELIFIQYAPVIFQTSVGMPHNLSLLLAGFNGVAYFLSSLIPIWIIDRLGRRKLMLFAAAGQCGCMAVLAGTVSNGTKAAGIVAVVMLFLFNFFFAVGLLAIPWLRKFHCHCQFDLQLIDLVSARRICAPRYPYTSCRPGHRLQLDLHLPRRRDHARLHQQHRLEDLRLLLRFQLLLHSSHLLLLSRDPMVVAGAN